MKCHKCKKKMGFFKAHGNLFSLKSYCKECWWEINGWDKYDDLGLDEMNEIKIGELNKRIIKLEKFASRSSNEK